MKNHFKETGEGFDELKGWFPIRFKNHDGVVVFESELTSIIKSPHNDTNYLGFRGLELMEIVFDSEL